APRTVTSMAERSGASLLVGKKSEVLLVDSVGANAAQNVARQVLGRLPGLVVAETEGAGFPSNGIAVRGLNPTQSIEMNVRQNGVIISADPYGYNETYYLPPLEAVERVELVRGAAGLQFGPQFGGMVNYVMKRGDPSRPFTGEIQQTMGSFGLSNTYGSVSGGNGRVRSFAYVQRRAQDGLRPNSDMLQTSGFASVSYAVSPSLTATVDYSLLRNRLHMPGGLSDEQFESGALQSFRARNWLTSPWNVGALRLQWAPSRAFRIESVTSVLGSSRSLVWRNEDGGPGALDTIDPGTGEFVPREVEREGFRNVTEELRLLADHRVFGIPSTVSAGVRWFNGQMHRQGGGEGTTASDYDLSLVSGAYEYDIRFAQSAVSGWLENAWRLGGRLTVTPGIRLERLRSRADGYTDTTFAPQVKTRTVPLLGLGANWLTSGSTTMYANVTQAYRPMDYSALTPIGGVSRVDPNLRDAHGVNADIGVRGTLMDDRVRFDVGAFRLTYDDRLGLVSRTNADGSVFTERTNVDNSVHQGVETYAEVTPFAVRAAGGAMRRAVTAFNSFAFTDAHYTGGEFKANRVEYASRIVERAGITFALSGLSTTFLTSYVGKAFGDANNTVRSEDAVVGVIPSYTVVDWSASLRLTGRWRLQGGVNNLADRRYFTRRTDEYPGPGIIPAMGRSVYFSVRALP
ncbi:MAG: TonB-dependent receptor, partial [Gemmatimonadaceae bacterium]